MMYNVFNQPDFYIIDCAGDASVCVHKVDGTYQNLAYSSTQSITFNGTFLHYKQAMFYCALISS